MLMIRVARGGHRAALEVRGPQARLQCKLDRHNRPPTEVMAVVVVDVAVYHDFSERVFKSNFRFIISYITCQSRYSKYQKLHLHQALLLKILRELAAFIFSKCSEKINISGLEQVVRGSAAVGSG